jgi:hypothetical protein
MNIDVNVYLHSAEQAAVLRKLAEILSVVKHLERNMSNDLLDLEGKVQENSDVIDSAVTLLTGIKAKLDEAIAANDPAALQALSAALGADTQQLADAVVANTPAAQA